MPTQNLKDLKINYENENDFAEIDYSLEIDEKEIQMRGRGRNTKAPKKANHGAKPCSSVMRKLKKKGWYHKVKDE